MVVAKALAAHSAPVQGPQQRSATSPVAIGIPRQGGDVETSGNPVLAPPCTQSRWDKTRPGHGHGDAASLGCG